MGIYVFYFIVMLFVGFLSAAEVVPNASAKPMIIRQVRSLPLSIHRQQIAQITFVADPYENFVSVHIFGPCIPVLPDNDNVIYLKNKPHMADQILSEQTLALRPYYILSCADYPHHEKLLTFFSHLTPRHFLRICLTFVDGISKTFKDYLLNYPTSVDIVNHYAGFLFPNILMHPLEFGDYAGKSSDTPALDTQSQSNAHLDNLNFCERAEQKEKPVRKKYRVRRYTKK
ncbi:MAG: hypothetical protein CNLJKLNK_00646 [Holosporales bacterium]